MVYFISQINSNIFVIYVEYIDFKILESKINIILL